MSADAPSPAAGGGGVSFFEAEGGTLEGLFAAAALKTAALLVDPATVQPGGLRDRWRLSAPDLDGLMAAWAREVIFQIATNRVLPARLTVRQMEASPGAPCRLDAEVDGELWDPGRHDAKHRGASLSRARVEKTVAGWSARLEFRTE